MGTSPYAHLAYGYDLGTEEDFKAVQRGEYGEPKLPWFDPEEDDEGDSEPTGDFAELAVKVLVEAAGLRTTQDRPPEEWSGTILPLGRRTTPIPRSEPPKTRRRTTRHARAASPGAHPRRPPTSTRTNR